MPESAEVHSATLDLNRTCTIQITNVSKKFCLSNPRVFMKNGFPFSPPQPTVRSMKTEVCSFVKDDHTAQGAAGVLVYDLFHMQKRSRAKVMAVMFSVPFDYNFYKNWLALGVFDPTSADHKLFDAMYNDKDEESEEFSRHKADGAGVKFNWKNVDVRGCMSDGGKAIVKLELYDKME